MKKRINLSNSISKNIPELSSDSLALNHPNEHFWHTKKETMLRAWSIKMVAMTGLEPVTPAL